MVRLFLQVWWEASNPSHGVLQLGVSLLVTVSQKRSLPPSAERHCTLRVQYKFKNNRVGSRLVLFIVGCLLLVRHFAYDIVKKVFGMTRILSCQRIMVHGLLPLCWTVSTEAMQVLSGVPPLGLKLMRRGIIYKLKKGIELCSMHLEECSNYRNQSLRDIKARLKDDVLKKWQSRWENS